MKKPHYNSKFTRKQFIVLIVCISTGFIIGYSYKLTKDEVKVNTSYLEQEESYREELISQQERNKELTEELTALQTKRREYEKNFAENEEDYGHLLEEAENLRLLLGEIPAHGEGIRVTLKDGEYNPNSTNPNEYIVHESHVFSVINELKVSGAEAISINGQRLKSNSYIRCNGPVITIDGNQYPAPFIIEAVGDVDTLIPALKLVGGVFDQLLNDRIVVTIEESDFIQMPTINDE
ncbi:uncharacterized protein YlxW (UPF0749 family) [Ureibacillus xyleni]|uniref:Uncharacterized protein YlxW (UPF0749 family) n=1 Tax=Ureibacillus xyleni TaxID=614648 RepID=A0A285REC3_9BACL|nr:DUF881 domain-containing protein [Ureibacillus xyleni]SOB92430.1 uncharacterized protein YlxW (UPF0749 family) [Ureibacillus xyleni]